MKYYLHFVHISKHIPNWSNILHLKSTKYVKCRGFSFCFLIALMGQSKTPFDSSDMSLSLGFLFEAQHMRPTAEWQQSQCETASQRELSEQLRGQRNKSFFKKASYKGCRANFHLLHQWCIPQLAVSPLLTRFTANLFTCLFWCSWLGVGGLFCDYKKKKCFVFE